jgi:hypothetical protein
MTGADTARRLKEFACNFAPPRKGRYVNNPAIADESGVIAVPPPVRDDLKVVAGAAVVVVGAGFALTTLINRKRVRRKEPQQND